MIRSGDVVTTARCKAPVLVSWVTSKGGAVGYKLLKNGKPSKREVLLPTGSVTAVQLKLVEYGGAS